MKIILSYLVFMYIVFVSSYIFYFYNELHRRETCAMLSTTFETFSTCLNQDWQDYQRIELAKFLEMKIGEVYDGKVFEIHEQ